MRKITAPKNAFKTKDDWVKFHITIYNERKEQLVSNINILKSGALDFELEYKNTLKKIIEQDKLELRYLALSINKEGIAWKTK